MPRMRWRPGLRPGPRWGSSRRSPRPHSRLVRGTPPPQEPHPIGAFGASILAPMALAGRHLRCLISSVYPPLFLAIHHWMMVLTYNSDEKKSFLQNGMAPSWTPWLVRNLHPVRDWPENRVELDLSSCPPLKTLNSHLRGSATRNVAMRYVLRAQNA